MDPSYVGVLLESQYRAVTRSKKKTTKGSAKKGSPKPKKGSAKKGTPKKGSAKKGGAKKGGAKKGTPKKSGQSYAVNYIVASQKNGKKDEFLTQWRKYPHSDDYTWQGYKNLRGETNDDDRKKLYKFIAQKKKLAERIDDMNNDEVAGLLSEYDRFFTEINIKESNKGKTITIQVTTKKTKAQPAEQHTFSAHVHKSKNYVELETPPFWGRAYLYARAKLAVDIGEGMEVREKTKSDDKMGTCTYRECLKDLVGIV